MALKTYLIAPYETGLQKNLEPWLIVEDAFATLQNAYVWRGRLRKRWGTSILGDIELDTRLRINIGTTDGAGNFALTPVPGSAFSIGQLFSVGVQRFTVYQSGAMYSTGAATGTFNTTTGAVSITGASVTTAVYYYPSTPVMGLLLRETTNINFEETVAFDTQFAYHRVAGSWERLALGSSTWTGSDSSFFWGVNYRGTNIYETYFYVVNYTAADNIRYLPVGSSTWSNLRPQLDSGATRFLETARLLIGFKDHLIALNTIEEETAVDRTYENRARWSQNGDPTATATSWLDDTPGRGGYVDAPIEQAIVTAEFIKDHLIVYFERSTWELVSTGNSTLPFFWQQINNELGAESTFSIIGFDKSATGVGNRGIHSCNGINVERIDAKIPDEVFKIHNGNNGPERVYGIRDYYRELVYWTFPASVSDPTFPTKILIWNYRNQSWAFFDDSYTCFGYFQKDSDITWGDLGARYGTWGGWNTPWSSPQAQSQFPEIIAGNQQGFVHQIETDKTSNGQSLQITDMTAPSTLTIIDHNLDVDDYILIEESSGITSLNTTIVQVASIVNSDTITIDTTFTGTYSGGGKVSRVSNINITSKQWNPGTPVGQQFRIPYIDFLLNRTQSGEIGVNYFLDSNEDTSINDSSPSGVLLGSNILLTRPEDNSTFQPNQERIWHRYYLQVQGQFIQIKICFTDSEMRNSLISRDSDFQLSGCLLYVEPQGRLIG